MSINISPETKVGKIEDWSAEDFVKGKRDEWIINGDTITQENLKKFFDKSKFSVASNGVLYRTDTVGCIPDILDIWFNQRVEFKKSNEKAWKGR